MQNVKTRQITNEAEQIRCLDMMFRYKNTWRIPVRDASNLLPRLVSKGWYAMYIMQYDPLPDELLTQYVQSHGQWMHGGGHTKQHNNLGMRWAMNMINMGHSVDLSDAPDIHGSIRLGSNTIRIYGDVGQCSMFPAWFDYGRWMQQGQLWINVFEGMELILEAQDNIANAFPMHELWADATDYLTRRPNSSTTCGRHASST